MTGDAIMAIIVFGLIFGPMVIILGLLTIAMGITCLKAFGTVIWDMLQDIWKLIKE